MFKKTSITFLIQYELRFMKISMLLWSPMIIHHITRLHFFSLQKKVLRRNEGSMTR